VHGSGGAAIFTCLFLSRALLSCFSTSLASCSWEFRPLQLDHLLFAPATMSGLEVGAVVASIIAAFASGKDMFKRMRAKQKARKQDKQGAKLTHEELRLQQSLSRGPQQIRVEYDRSAIRLGRRFEIGDTAALTSLAHTLLVLNTGLANIIHQALSEDSKAREMSKRSLLGLSEFAAADTLHTLGQLNKRLTSVPSLTVQTQPQPSTQHRRKKKPLKQKDQALLASRMNPPDTKEKKRPGPDPLARGGWVRSKSGTSAVSSGSSTPRPAKQTSNHSSFSLATDSSLSQPEPAKWNSHIVQSSPPCTCGAHVQPARHGLDTNMHQPHSNVPPQFQELDLLLASPDVFNTDFLPPRPPKIPIERPASSRKPRPPSVATFLTASTKIGEIPEHRWLDRPDLPWDNRPLPYISPPPLEPEPAKRKARGFKSWWKNHGRDEESVRKELQVPAT
jgi:hypothetical protein